MIRSYVVRGYIYSYFYFLFDKIIYVKNIRTIQQIYKHEKYSPEKIYAQRKRGRFPLSLS